MKKLKTGLSVLSEIYVAIAATIGIIISGLAAAGILGYSLTNKLVVDVKMPNGLAGTIGVSFAVVLESIGAIAAHTALNAEKKTTRQWAAIVLFSYTCIGIVYMWIAEHNALRYIGTLMYLVTTAFYFVAGLQKDSTDDRAKAEQKEQRELKSAQVQNEFNLEQQRLDEELKRELLRQKAAANKEVRLLKAKQAPEKVSQNFPKVSESSNNVSHDWRKVPIREKLELINLPKNEISERYSISGRSAQNWKKWAAEIQEVLDYLKTRPFALKTPDQTAVDLGIKLPVLKKHVKALTKGGILQVTEKGIVKSNKVD